MRKAIFLAIGVLFVSGCATPAADLTQPSATATPSYRDSVLTDHPVAYWPMDETSGLVMTDASGNGNNGAYAGNVGLAQSGPIKATPNAAIALDGASTWATVPSSNSLQVNAITIELWIKKGVNVGYGVYVAKNFAPAGGPSSGWFQLMNSYADGRLEFRVTSDNATLMSSTVLGLNTWYYVVCTYDGTTAKLYLNGKLDATATLSAMPKQTVDPLFIGRRSDGWLNKVMLSSVAIYGRSLPADRIAEHWQAATE